MQHLFKLLCGVLMAAVIIQAVYIKHQTREAHTQPNKTVQSDRSENYAHGMDLYHNEGYTQAFDATGDVYYFYLLAWLDYQKRDIEAATKRVDFLIQGTTEETIKARAYELKGFILYQKQEYKKALELFRISEQQHIQQKHYRNIFYSRQAIASCLADMGLYEDAREMLIKTFESAIQLKTPDLRRFYALSALVEHSLGNHSNALKYETECLKTLRASTELANAHLRLGFYAIHLGYVNRARQHYHTALTLNKELKESVLDKTVYYLIRRCSQEVTQEETQTLKEILTISDAPHLRTLALSIDDWNCPQIDQGDPSHD